ncbi:MAG TPA: hypothetical protein PKY29_04330 [Ferruginibacter sp.]|nr:hypothetical protein [Ferruginibacter sp.]HRQ20515.1 hypothetical protein [Ferruginibacter sp.]
MAKKLTQKERIGEALKGLSPDVTNEDRMEYKQKYGGTSALISIYLSGKVHDADRGVKMLRFFRTRIQKRETVI